MYLVMWKFALRVAALWASVLLVELAYHWYLGSHLAGATFALILYNTPRGGIMDFFLPTVFVGICLGYWCVNLRGRAVAVAVLCNVAIFIALQWLWLAAVRPGEARFPVEHTLGFLLQELIFGFIFMGVATSGIWDWERRKRLGKKNGSAVGRNGPSAPSDNGGAK